MWASLEEFDADPDIVLDLDGHVINTKTRETYSATPEMKFTKRLGVRHEKGTNATAFMTELERRIPDANTRALFKRIAGSCLVGRNPMKFPIFIGESGGWKSTSALIIKDVCGTYACRIPTAALLIGRQGGDAPMPSIARLRGVRMVMMSEAPKGSRWNDTLINELLSNEPIAARDLHEKMFEFRFVGTLVPTMNDLPYTSGSQSGYWNRAIAVPFSTLLSSDEWDDLWVDRLIETEGSGILNYMLEGAYDYQQRGFSDLVMSKEVTDATSEYKKDENPLLRFVEDCCETGEDFMESHHLLFRVWCRYLREAGEGFHLHKTKTTSFGKELKALGYVEHRGTGGIRYRKGLSLNKRIQDTLESLGVNALEDSKEPLILTDAENVESLLEE
jgi:putative DNA primase/helicase